jgi:hypothetical protein
MSLMSEYQRKLQALEQLKRELAKMEDNETLKRERAFSESLEALMNEYDIKPAEVLTILGVGPSGEKSSTNAKRSRVSVERRYRNPHTGEEVSALTMGNPVLRAWSEQYGKEEVRSWKEG